MNTILPGTVTEFERTRGSGTLRTSEHEYSFALSAFYGLDGRTHPRKGIAVWVVFVDGDRHRILAVLETDPTPAPSEKERDMKNPEWTQSETGYTTYRAKYKGADLQITRYIDGAVNWRVQLGPNADNKYAYGESTSFEDAAVDCEVARKLLIAAAWMSGDRDFYDDQESEAAQVLEHLFTEARGQIADTRECDGVQASGENEDMIDAQGNDDYWHCFHCEGRHTPGALYCPDGRARDGCRIHPGDAIPVQGRAGAEKDAQVADTRKYDGA